MYEGEQQMKKSDTDIQATRQGGLELAWKRFLLQPSVFSLTPNKRASCRKRFGKIAVAPQQINNSRENHQHKGGVYV